MIPYPEEYNPDGCDVFVWMVGDEIRACGISDEGKKHLKRRVVPEQGYALIHENPDQFIREADGLTVGVALLEPGKIGYVVPNLS